MTLLIAMTAAVISTAVWYTSANARKMKTGTLCMIYWAASLMWMVDAVAEYIEAGAGYFTPSAADMLNDSFLGLAAVLLGAVIWLGVLLKSDPSGVLKSTFVKK